MFFLTKAPIWIAAVLVVLITVASMFGPVLVRRRLGLEWLRTNNEVAGFKFATVGVIYAVLLGFAAITQDWPAMQLGRGSPEATRALGATYTALLRYQPTDLKGAALMTELLHQLDLVTPARRARVVMYAGIVPGIVWAVLFGGALITIGFTFLFGTKNLYAQAIMTGALSILIFSALLVIIAIDHPFAGSVSVESEPLAAVLSELGSDRNP